MYIFADKKYEEKFTGTKVIEPVSLKGQFSEMFDFRFFHESVGAPEYPWIAVSSFFENSQRYSQLTGVVDTGGK
jgi:hypothetical protein